MLLTHKIDPMACDSDVCVLWMTFALVCDAFFNDHLFLSSKEERDNG